MGNLSCQAPPACRLAFMDHGRDAPSGQVPGVQAVGINAGMPPVYNWQMTVTLPGQSRPEPRPAMFHQTNADYLQVMVYLYCAAASLPSRR
jgi:hypothetical protein